MQGDSGIYVIVNLNNGKKYVGQSYSVSRRFLVHKNKLRKGKHPNIHLQSAWNKYGENSFSFEILEYCPIDALNEREEYWINAFKTYTSEGYNMTLGGNGNRGYVWSRASREHLSAVMKISVSRYWSGKRLTEAHKEKLRAAAKNRSAETKRKIGEASRRAMANPEIKQKMILHQNNKAVYCLELNETFYSISEAARETGLHSGNISKVCNGLIKKTGGYHFIFADVPRDTP